MRIAEAKWQQRETDTSIIGIALDVGYSNSSHFEKIFSSTQRGG